MKYVGVDIGGTNLKAGLTDESGQLLAVQKRYGFVYVDRTDDDVKECKRYRKDSFYWYKNVIATNGKNLE